MRAYSLDLRQRVLDAVDAGKLNRLEIARLFSVSPSWIRRLVRRRREDGTIAPREQQHGPLPKLDETLQQQLRALVREDSDATIAELRERLPIQVGMSTVWRALVRLQLPRKKSRCTPASRIGPTCKSSASNSEKQPRK